MLIIISRIQLPPFMSPFSSTGVRCFTKQLHLRAINCPSTPCIIFHPTEIIFSFWKPQSLLMYLCEELLGRKGYSNGPVRIGTPYSRRLSPSVPPSNYQSHGNQKATTTEMPGNILCSLYLLPNVGFKNFIWNMLKDEAYFLPVTETQLEYQNPALRENYSVWDA